jgi:hypothetical protein
VHPAFKESIPNQANYKSEPSQPNVEENVLKPNDVVVESVNDVPDVVKANIEKQKQEDLKRINDLKKTTSVAGKRHKVLSKLCFAQISLQKPEKNDICQSNSFLTIFAI